MHKEKNQAGITISQPNGGGVDSVDPTPPPPIDAGYAGAVKLLLDHLNERWRQRHWLLLFLALSIIFCRKAVD